jgi:biotin carboxyl carrier protein
VQEGDELQAGKIVNILDAMKMEINVLTDAHLAGATVVKVLLKLGDSIERW